MCLTATATANVRKDAIRVLGLNEERLEVFTMTTFRENLHYEIRFKTDEDDHFDDFLGWLKGVYKRRRDNTSRAAEVARRRERPDGVPGIIYALTRNECETIARRLRDNGIGARPFHAGLSNDEKTRTLSEWINNTTGYDVIVATTAFGMGIDKENVRFVVHWSMPKSFEGYYQEAGRAGRDRRASACIMYYSREDRDRAIAQLCRGAQGKKNGQDTTHYKEKMGSLMYLAKYAEDTEKCRHTLISEYFGETEKPACCASCDLHKDQAAVRRRKKGGLRSEEWMSTQSELGTFNEEYGEFD